MKRARIILADDHNLLVDTFKAFLQPHFDVVATFADGQHLVQAAPALMPDVVVLDVGMPIMNGLIAGQRLKQLLPRVKLIYLTMNLDPDVAAEAFRLGAAGYLVKTSAASELVHAINEVVLARSYITPVMTKDMVGSFVQNFKQRKIPHQLTLRQREVLQLLAEGRSMKEAAYLLNVTPRTVAFHKYTIMDQLQLKTSAELIQFALKLPAVAA